MARAAKEIQKKNAALARVRAAKRDELKTATQMASSFVGAAGAALIDSKYGDGQKPAELAGVPTNSLAASAGLAVAFLAPKSMPGRDVIGFAAVGMGNAALYRFVFEKLEEREAEKALKEQNMSVDPSGL